MLKSFFKDSESMLMSKTEDCLCDVIVPPCGLFSINYRLNCIAMAHNYFFIPESIY